MPKQASTRLRSCIGSREAWTVSPEQKKVLPDSRILSPSLPPEEHVGIRRTAYIVADMRLTIELLVEAEITLLVTVPLASF
jgi:hypothetical protein